MCLTQGLAYINSIKQVHCSNHYYYYYSQCSRWIPRDEYQMQKRNSGSPAVMNCYDCEMKTPCLYYLLKGKMENIRRHLLFPVSIECSFLQIQEPTESWTEKDNEVTKKENLKSAQNSLTQKVKCLSVFVKLEYISFLVLVLAWKGSPENCLKEENCPNEWFQLSTSNI